LEGEVSSSPQAALALSLIAGGGLCFEYHRRRRVRRQRDLVG
jgi:hypothetical protein